MLRRLKNLSTLTFNMNNKKTFFNNIILSLLGFCLLLIAFWLAGARALPFGSGVFHTAARQIKPWVILDKKPSQVLISNSRGVYGYNPKQLGLSNFYNASLTGISVNEMLRLTKHVYYSGAGYEHIYLGIDTICSSLTKELDDSFFNSDYLQNAPTFSHNVKRIRAILGSPLNIIKRVIQNRPGIDSFGYSSFFPDSNYQTGGVLQSLNAREVSDYSKPEFSKNCDTTAYIALLGFLFKHDLKFTIFMNPKHIRNYIAYNLTDRLDGYLWMVKELAVIHQRISQQSNLAESSLCLFNQIDRFTTESFEPSLFEYDPMRFWFENSHFKPSLGNNVLIKLVNNQYCDDEIEVFLEKFTSDLKAFTKSNPSVVASVRNNIF